jgi:hypothetical protein
MPERHPATRYRCLVNGDRVEAVVDTGRRAQTLEIIATRAGRRVEETISHRVHPTARSRVGF